MWPDCIAQSTTWSGTVPSAYIDLSLIQNGQSEWHLSNSKLGFKKVCRTSPNVPQYEQLLTLLVPSKAQIELTKHLRQKTQLKLKKTNDFKMVLPKLTASVYLEGVGAQVYGKFLNRTSFWGLRPSIRCKKTAYLQG